MPSEIFKSADAVVVGAGIIGASVACYLAQAGLKVVVIEKEKLPGTGSTAAAAGGVRTIFPEKLDTIYAMETMTALETFKQDFGWEDDFRRNGYLFTASTNATFEKLTERAYTCNSGGGTAKLLDAEQVREIIPMLDTGHIVGGVYTPFDGYCDPYGLTMGFLTKARDHGASVWYKTELQKIKLHKGRVEAAYTDQGKVNTPVIVNCAGPFARNVAQMVGVDVPAIPHRRYVFVTGEFPELSRGAPLCINEDEKFYFKPESGAVIMSGMEEEETEPDDTGVRWERAEVVAERALKNVPVFKKAGFARAWAGLRTLTPDRRAILGPTPVEGFYLACGFSGHGICHCVPAGKVLADCITKKKTTDLPIEPYFLSRFSNR